MKKYSITLTHEERSQLKTLVKTGKIAAYRIRHANVLLAVDASEGAPQLSDAQAVRALGVSARSIEYLRQRFVEGGLDSALERKKRELPPREQLFDGEKEARLIATARGPAPVGLAIDPITQNPQRQRRKYTDNFLWERYLRDRDSFGHDDLLLVRLGIEGSILLG